MKILFIGGTRFLGLSLLKRFSGKGFDITVLSRREVKEVSDVIFIKGEKKDVINQLSGMHYDVVIDFISYDVNDFKINHNTLSFERYYFISSTWLAKIAPTRETDKFILEFDTDKLHSLPEITRKYLLGKLNVENHILEKSRLDKKYNILRLPIFLGAKDHTKRIHYYIERVVDDFDILLLNNGINKMQIAWVEDLADLLYKFILKGGADYLIWEALPTDSIRLLDIYRYLEEALNKQNRFIAKDLVYFMNSFPEYLEYEPFWREEIYRLSEHNLFVYNNMKSTDYKSWLKDIATEVYLTKEVKTTDIRTKEIKYLESL